MVRTLLLSSALFLGVFIPHVLSPNSTSFDSRWVVQTALSLLHEGNADLNEYPRQLEAYQFYAMECVAPDGKRQYPIVSLKQCPDGRFYNFHPVGIAVLAAPEVWLLERVFSRTHALAAQASTPVRRQLLEGDLAGAHPAVELLIASSWIALAAVFLYWALRPLLAAKYSLALTLLFAYGTSAWSIGSRALWMHGASILLLSLVLLLLVRGEKRQDLWIWMGPILAAAFFLRPTNLVPAAAFLALLAWRSPRRFAQALAASAPVAAFFFWMNYAMYGQWIAPYSQVQRENSWGLELHRDLWIALAGNLISPARGLFIYSPVFLLSAAGLWLWWKRRDQPDTALALSAIAAGHWILISIYSDWHGGDCYGPRYFADLAPILVFALVPVMDLVATRRVWAATFILLAGMSIWMHYRGAFCWPCIEWNNRPGPIREQQYRLWDWRDPPFFRR